MSGIPVYTLSPIKATKASGTTPQTAVTGTQISPLAPSPTSTATAPSYPSARPGAAAVPAPTAAGQRYAPLQPTPTIKTDTEPPTPQPGAVPTPFNTSTVPPAPKAGETYQPQQTTAPEQPTTQPFPPQMAYPPPTTYGYQPPKSLTDTSNGHSVAYPVGIPSAEGGPRRSIEHPPGYYQNVYASEPTSDQRRAQEAQLANDSSLSRSADIGGASGFDSDGVWNTAKKWVQTAGKKVSEAEAEVWRKVTKE